MPSVNWSTGVVNHIADSGNRTTRPHCNTVYRRRQVAKAARWVRASDIKARLRMVVRASGLEHRQIAALAGVTPGQVSEWLSDDLGKASPPRSRLETLCRNTGWPLGWFTEKGEHPPGVVNAPLTAPGLRIGVVAEASAGYTAEAGRRAMELRFARAIESLRLVVEDLEQLSAELRASAAAAAGEIAEAGHPSQPPPEERQGSRPA